MGTMDGQVTTRGREGNRGWRDGNGQVIIKGWEGMAGVREWTKLVVVPRDECH